MVDKLHVCRKVHRDQWQENYELYRADETPQSAHYEATNAYETNVLQDNVEEKVAGKIINSLLKL